MILGDTVLGRRIAGLTRLRADFALSGHAAPELILNFLRAAFLDRIGATAHDQRDCA
jgi:hypothetical protein